MPYGDWYDWGELIKVIRQVEKELELSGFNLLKCKIYMDSAGLKIRVSPIQSAFLYKDMESCDSDTSRFFKGSRL